MSKIQFNAKSFATTRKTLNAYFGAKYDLAVELDKAKKSVSAFEKVIATDKAELSKIAMGETEGIVRTAEAIRESLKVNYASYVSGMAKYKSMLEDCEDAISDAEKLFSDKDSALYKAYVAYAESLTDETYTAYAKALSERFVALGLTDATAENVTPFMVNADRELKGRTAVKKGTIQSALSSKAFAQAVLRKIYVDKKDMFASKKFADYVRKCAEKKASNK